MTPHLILGALIATGLAAICLIVWLDGREPRP